MHTNFLHKLSTGGIVSLPAPTFTLYRCVVEEPNRLLVLFGVKTPTDESADAVLRRCKSAAPDLEWIPHLHDGWHKNGATEGLQFYEIQKVDGRLVWTHEGVAGMLMPFALGIAADAAPAVYCARPLTDIRSILRPGLKSSGSRQT